MLTVNGRVCLRRIRWHDPQAGSMTVIDTDLDHAERTISLGVREMACRLNTHSSSFDATNENLARTAQVQASKETIRMLVEQEGQKVRRRQQEASLPIPWSAGECPHDPANPTTPTRIYLGCDGVKVPMVTDIEKKKRREKVKAKRRKRGKKCKPLARAKKGAEQKYKEFKIIAYSDQTQAHRLVVRTKGDHKQAGRLMRRLAALVHPFIPKVRNSSQTHSSPNPNPMQPCFTQYESESMR